MMYIDQTVDSARWNNGVTGPRCLYVGRKKRLFRGQGGGNRVSRNARPWRRMGGLEMFFHVLLDGGEWSSSLTGLISTFDIQGRIKLFGAPR